MVKKKEDLGGVWRTVGGRRIFIKDGQDLYEAMNDSGKFTNLKKTNSQRKAKERTTEQVDKEYELYKKAREDENSIDPMTENSTDWEKLDRKYKDRYEKEQSFMKDINDLRKLTESSLSEKPHDYYNKMKETRDEYLKNYDKYSGDARPEKMTADDVWSPGYKESMYEQFENRIRDYKGDDYEINKIQNTLAIIDKEASGSLHNKYLSQGGKYSEEYDRKQYGDAKIDSAIMREQEMLRRGYTNIATNINPRGLVNSFEYSDMIITGEKNGVQVSINYNKNGDSAISLKSRDKNGGYGELMITKSNFKTVNDIISRGNIGSDFRESMPYSAYETKKLTDSESKEYYEKANKHYAENKEAHYYDNQFFNDYREKLKDEIIARRKKNK